MGARALARIREGRRAGRRRGGAAREAGRARGVRLPFDVAQDRPFDVAQDRHRAA